MAQRDDMRLMQHLDGELPDDGVELSAEDQLVLRSLEQVGDAVRTHLELAADDVDGKLDAMWSRIDRSISSNGAAAVEREAVRSRVPVADAAQDGLFARIGKWMDQYRSHMLTGAVAAGAAAVLVIALRPPTTVVKREIVQVPVKPDPSLPVQTFAKSEPPLVESLDVAEGSGTILTIPGEEGENPTTVIWVSRDEMEGPI